MWREAESQSEEAVTKVFCGSGLISGNLLHRRIAKLRLRAIVYLPIFWSRKKWYSCLWEFLFQLSFLFMSSTRNFYLRPSYLVLVWSKVIWRRTKSSILFLIRHLPIYLRPTTNHEDIEFPRCNDLIASVSNYILLVSETSQQYSIVIHYLYFIKVDHPWNDFMIVLQCIQIPNALYLRHHTILLLDFIKFLSWRLTIPLITVCMYVLFSIV